MLAGRPREPKRCPTDARREAQGARICPEIGCVDRACGLCVDLRGSDSAESSSFLINQYIKCESSSRGFCVDLRGSDSGRIGRDVKALKMAPMKAAKMAQDRPKIARNPPRASKNRSKGFPRPSEEPQRTL